MANKCESFEENLEKLKKTVDSLEGGNLPLKETIEKFEEGLKISKLCINELEITKQRVEKVIEEDGKIEIKPFED